VTSGASTESVAKAVTQVVFVTNPLLKKKTVVSLNPDAQVQPIAPGAGVPSGMVTFEIQTKSRKTVTETALGSAALSDGLARLVVKPNSVLRKTVIILYGGDADFTASTAMPQVVTPQAPKNLTRPMVAQQAKGPPRVKAATATARV